MVSFICNTCQECVKKNRVDKHCETQCAEAWYFTCVDCNKVFAGFEFRDHTSCISEEQKYHGQYAKKPKNANTPKAANTHPTTSDTDTTVDTHTNTQSHTPTHTRQNVCAAQTVFGIDCGGIHKLEITNKRSSGSIAEIIKSQSKPHTDSDTKLTDQEMRSILDEILLKSKKRRLQWKPLTEKVVKEYIARHPAVEDTQELRDTFLTSIPNQYLSDVDSYVRMP